MTVSKSANFPLFQAKEARVPVKALTHQDIQCLMGALSRIRHPEEAGNPPFTDLLKWTGSSGRSRRTTTAPCCP